MASSSPVENSATRGPARDLQRRRADRRRHSERCGRKPDPGAEDPRAALDVFAAARIDWPANGRIDANAAVDDAALLLHDDRIGAGRHLRAGEDARRRARARALADAAGGDPLADAKHAARLATSPARSA
jgi:hypothetical protein